MIDLIILKQCLKYRLRMKTNFKIFFFSFFLLLLWACSNKKEANFIAYDLTNVTDSVELNLSELLDDIRIVPLETDTSFLTETTFMTVNDKYIVMLGKKEIHEFDAVTGKHIRKLAINGKGPNEYENVSSAVVDNKKNILYFSQNFNKNIINIDLTTGNFLPKINSKKQRSSDLLAIMPDGNIATHDDSLMFSVIDIKNGQSIRMIDSLITPKKTTSIKIPQTYGMQISGVGLVTNNEEMFLYSQKFNDTVYRYYSPSKIEKVFSVTYKDELVDSEGTSVFIPYICNKYILCTPYKWGFSITGEHTIMSLTNKGIYIINREDNLIKKVSKLFCNNNGLTITLPRYIISYGGTFISPTLFAQSINAYELKEQIEELLENKQLPDSDKKYLEDLNSKLTEGSNPVIIIGKRKK